MYRLALIITWITGGALFAALHAQESAGRHPDFDYIRQSDARLTSYNAAGLYIFPLEHISAAEVSFNKKDGDFTNYYQSGNSYEIGGLAESIFRLSPKTVLYGKLGYSNFKGQGMGGSAFINPYANPFDIVECADSTSGEKQLEQYHLTGALSTDLYKGLRLGVKADYLAANYAKHKDLRHKNKLMDMWLTAGLSYPISRHLEIGANYFYRRSTEGIEFNSYGNKDQQFYSLISFGSFFGRREIFGDTGYTETQDDKPLFNKYHGASLQLMATFPSGIKFFNEFTFKSRDGYFGKRSPSSVVFSAHNSDILEYSGLLSIATKKDLHTIGLTAGNEKLENHENIYKEVITGGNNKDVTYHGKNKVLDREAFTARLAYTGNLNVVNYHPSWTLKADAGYSQNEQTASVYPYYRKQTIRVFDFNLAAGRNLFAGGGSVYNIGLRAGFNTGSGTKKDDGMYTSESADGGTPYTLDTNLDREYEYLTAPRLKAAASFRYTRPIAKDVQAYAAISYQFTKGMNVEYLPGDTFGDLTIRIGCTF